METKSTSLPVNKSTNVLPRSTINLKSAFNGTPKQEEKTETVVVDTSSDRRVREEDVRAAWLEFAELKKNQIAEYGLLKKEFTFSGVTITIQLANPIEEPLLANIRVQLIAHLRGKLNNNSITVTSVLLERETKKVAYTAKEKFDQLAEKNPALTELRERFGLDPDF